MMKRLEQAYLLLAGAVAVLTGLGMVTMPAAFYGSYGINAAASVNLVNELRSPGLWMMLAGLAMGLGAAKAEMRATSLGIAAAFYLSYSAARSISIALDGLPDAGLMAAMALEIGLGVGALALWRMRSTSAV